MCGIAGIVDFSEDSKGIDIEELRTIRDAMALRGPDGLGEWVSPERRVALGHRRLTIIGFDESSRQPMMSADGSVVVVFNGEIYNYKELRRRLVSAGRRFESQSDTEVLIHLYQERGCELVQELRGMFAFAIWDSKKEELLLARDPYGIKPLYFSANDRQVRFASQVKAILAGGAVSRELDPAGLVGFLTWGNVPEPFTCFQSIRALPAGSTMVVAKTGVMESRQYFDPRNCYREPGPVETDAQVLKRVRSSFEDSVRAHLVADVPVGVFLSAGVDSTAMATVASRVSIEPLKTVTLAFEEFKGTFEDESPLAEETACILGCDHQTIRLSLSDVLGGMDKVAQAMDQPSIDGVNSYWVSLAAKERGLKVALSGLGGDELFGGYPSFSRIPKMVSVLAIPGKLGLLRPMAEIAKRYLPADRRREKLIGLFNTKGNVAGVYMAMRGLFMPHELGRILNPDILRAGLAVYNGLVDAETRGRGVWPLKAKVAVLEQSLYMRNQLLRDADWAGMAHSLEVRVPFVDHVLCSRLASMVLRGNSLRHPKWSLAYAADGKAARKTLLRKKSGFGFPFGDWLRSGKWNPWPEASDKHLFAPALGGVLVGEWKKEAEHGRLSWARPYAVKLLEDAL
jgi:asparagine synthase (glutamine-hydrolysing)